ncbi:hypothetical protein WJX79_004642 [Trebouxia sp. C0005]|nr:MAG: CAAX prenyl protease 1 protein [Trebouxia sp. A1-2]
MNIPYLQLVIQFSLSVYALHTYLDLRQLKALQRTKPPPQLADHLTDEQYKKAQAYNVDKWWFSFISNLFTTAVSVLLLVNWYMPKLWSASTALAVYFGYTKSHEVLITVIYNLLDSGKDLLLGLPFGLYSTFVVEQRHGFNKQSLGLFIKDQVIAIGLGIVLLPPIVAAITLILKNTGPLVAIYLWFFILVVSIFMMTIYPIAIAPLFNKFTPLPEGSLRNKIESLAGSLKFPLTKLFLIDGSVRSAHSNAYMYGFFKNKRIVLYDTLVEQCQEEEVTAVLAHELGHWKLGHTPKNFVLSQVVILAQMSLFTFTRTAPGLFESFGFIKEQPVFMSIVLFQLLQGPIDEVLGLLINQLSRRYEFQADNFAVTLGHAPQLREALKKLDSNNKSAPNVDPWYSAYHYSHPPLLERLTAIDIASKKTR